MFDPVRQQQLIDALQVIAPLAQRLAATSRQQQADAAALLDATARAVTIVQPQPGAAREKGGARRHEAQESRSAKAL